MKKLLCFLVLQTCLFKSNSQNIGIGVANPQQKLHVGGNVRVDGFANPGNGVITSNINGDLQRLNFTGNSNDVLKGDGSFGSASSSSLPSGAIVGSSNSIDSNLLKAGFSFFGEMPNNFYSFIERPGSISSQYAEVPMYEKGKPGAQAPPSARSNFCSVWSGLEMLIWGGIAITTGIAYKFFNDGKKYNPATDTWTPMSALNAPTKKAGAANVWTGTEMIVWGGGDSLDMTIGTYFYSNTGARYNPVTNVWTSMTQVGAPAARAASAVWTGTQMIVWGGNGAAGSLSTGSRYNPVTNSWVSMTFIGAPVSAGTETKLFWDVSSGYVIVLGINVTGGRYNPATNTWSAMANCPANYDRESAVWTGSQLLVYSRQTHAMYKYSPATNLWTTVVTAGNYPNNTNFIMDAVWTGFEIIYLTSYNDGQSYSTNRLYRFNNGTNTFDSYTVVSTNNTIAAGNNFLMAGSMILKWGGELTNNGIVDFKQASQGLKYYLSAGIGYPAYYLRGTIDNIIYLYKKN